MATSVKVVLYTSKKLSNGESPIMLRIIKDRKPKYISVGTSCTEEFWDNVNNLPKKKHPFFKEIKVKIARKKLEAEKLILDLENDEKDLSAYEIRSKLKNVRIKNQSVFDYFDSVCKRLLNNGQVKNAEIYKDAKRSLYLFTPNKKLHFSDIDLEFLSNYEDYLKSTGKKPNTIYLYLRTLRALINRAIKDEVCAEKYYPFKRFTLAKYSSTTTEKRAIAKQEIEKIKQLNLSAKEHLIDSRNLFLFSFYCRGMNFTDMALLKWRNINAERLSYTRQKTKEYFSIELLQPAIRILKHYKKITYIDEESYVFPILSEDHQSPKSIYYRKVKILKKTNTDLKEIAGLAKIKSKLTTYVARHSYATILKMSGIQTSIISQALGHDSEKTTRIYLESFGNNILDEASKLIL
jgi:integrase